MYIKRSLSDKLTVYSCKRLMQHNVKSKKHRYQTTVGIGGNVGDVKRRFRHLFTVLNKDKRVELVRTSLILKNPPFGYTDQDDFFNSIILIRTSMTSKVFLDYLLRLEKKFGRKRSFENAPRTLDLDIIFFDNIVMNTPKLTLPHAAWHERESVVIPLASLVS